MNQLTNPGGAHLIESEPLSIVQKGVGKLMIPNGVFVRQGAEPDPAMMRALEKRFAGTLIGNFVPLVIPSDQSTDKVCLGDPLTYGISPVTPKSVNSQHFSNCLSLSAIGESERHQKNAAVYAHVPNVTFLADFRDAFVRDIDVRLDSLRRLTRDGSRDVLIAGGKIEVGTSSEAKDVLLYTQSIILLRDIVRKHFGFSPYCLPPAAELLDRYYSLDTPRKQLLCSSKFAPLIQTGSDVYSSDNVEAFVKNFCENTAIRIQAMVANLRQ